MTEDLELTGVVIEAPDAALLVLSVPHVRIDLARLTATQRLIAAAVVAGCSNAEIASLRRSSVRTVANHLAAIFRRLGVGSRRELAALVASDALPPALTAGGARRASSPRSRRGRRRRR